MRAVLYTDDLIPITVLEIGPYYMDLLDRRRSLILLVYRPISYLRLEDAPVELTFYQVEIRSEYLVRKGVRHRILTTADEELALLLEPDFLPGQSGEVQRRERQARAEGAGEFLTLVRGMLKK